MPSEPVIVFLPYQIMSTNGWINLCQINKTSGTIMHVTQTIFLVNVLAKRWSFLIGKIRQKCTKFYYSNAFVFPSGFGYWFGWLCKFVLIWNNIIGLIGLVLNKPIRLCVALYPQIVAFIFRAKKRECHEFSFLFSVQNNTKSWKMSWWVILSYFPPFYCEGRMKCTGY